MSSFKSLDIRVPPLELKENSELECWTDFITRFEVALINTSLSITPTTTTSESKGTNLGSSGSTESKSQLDLDDADYRRGGLLLNSIGTEGYKIFTKWKIMVRDISYNDLVARYTAEFTKKQNIFVTRYKFFNLEQLGGEAVESFLDRITKAASYCALGDLEDAMILQCLTKGIKSEALRKEILYIEDCDLDKARRVCFTFESAQRSNTVIADKSDHSSVGAVGYSGRTFSAKKGSSGTTTGPSKQRPCGICKSSEHWANKCPEKKKLKCTFCGKKGHSADYCRNRVQVVEAHKSQDGAESEESL